MNAMKKAVIITPDDATETVDFGGYSTITQAVGGWIEAVHTGTDITAWCNEEGKLHGLPINRAATALWWELDPAMANHDVLVGAVLITGGTTPAGETLGLTTPQVERIVRRVSEIREAQSDDHA